VAADSIVCTKRRIRALIAESKVPEDPRHAENTLAWLLKTKPDADEALQISALGHDIDRAVEARKIQRASYEDYDAFKAATPGIAPSYSRKSWRSVAWRKTLWQKFIDLCAFTKWVATCVPKSSRMLTRFLTSM